MSILKRICGDERLSLLNQAFELANLSYKRVGLQYPSAEFLFNKTFVWDVYLTNNKLVAFMGFKVTNFGLKAVVMASDKKLCSKLKLINLMNQLKNEGYYGEMSGTPAAIAHRLFIPVVHVSRVIEIMPKKEIYPIDNITYRRHISGLSVKEKQMFGVPFDKI